MATVRRAAMVLALGLAVVPAAQVWLGAGEQLREAVSSVEGLRADRLVVEPSGRDTLAAVALGCAVIAAADPDVVVAVLTADHLIEPVEHECAVEIDLALDRDLRHPAPRRPEPALSHTSMVWPGSMTSSSTSVS